MTTAVAATDVNLPLELGDEIVPACDRLEEDSASPLGVGGMLWRCLLTCGSEPLVSGTRAGITRL